MGLKMGELDERVKRNEIDILRDRLDTMASDVKELKRKKGVLSVFKDLASILTPLIIAGIGFYATYSIKGALEREQLQLSHLKEMRELMVKLSSPNTELSEAEATAVLLAAFGPPAIVPLIHELQADGLNRPLAAQEGLKALAFSNQKMTCEKLSQVLKSRTRLFKWETHKHVIELLSDMDCSDGLTVLKEFKTILESPGGFEKYCNLVRQAPDQKNFNKLVGKVKTAIQTLEK